MRLLGANTSWASELSDNDSSEADGNDEIMLVSSEH